VASGGDPLKLGSYRAAPEGIDQLFVNQYVQTLVGLIRQGTRAMDNLPTWVVTIAAMAVGLNYRNCLDGCANAAISHPGWRRFAGSTLTVSTPITMPRPNAQIGRARQASVQGRRQSGPLGQRARCFHARGLNLD
jgi:hypothetical protein